jgi:hypothetical protein
MQRKKWTGPLCIGGLEIDPSRFEIRLKAGRLRKWVSNQGGSIFRPFAYLKTSQIFLFFPLSFINKDKKLLNGANDANK